MALAANHRVVNEYPSTLALAQGVAWELLDLLSQRPNAPKYLAVSGGRGAQALFAELTRKATPLHFSAVHVFWADERCVLPSSAESNFRLAQECLLGPLAIPAENIHRLKGELAPEAAVAEANAEVGRIIPSTSAGLPRFDLVLLGMGEDGHVASLFPNASDRVLACPQAYLHVDNAPKPPPNRLSLSLAAIAAAKEIWVLVTGEGKEASLKESLTSDRTPLGRLLRLRPDTRLFCEKPASATPAAGCG